MHSGVLSHNRKLCKLKGKVGIMKVRALPLYPPFLMFMDYSVARDVIYAVQATRGVNQYIFWGVGGCQRFALRKFRL